MKIFFKSRPLLLLFLSSIRLTAYGQDQWNSARIQHELNKLPVNGTVLYIAAHPDDENTRLISWLANEKKFRTAYLSLTRGDGGQNLIGNELGVKLGIIRTHELMEARKIDGGEQYFTRAYDFGYSKSPQETFKKWNRDSILSDMVFVIRLIRPDVIVTRFPADESYKTHGHHTASALLAVEAYEAAADPNRFPEHFAHGVKAHSVKRIYYNASTWWNPDLPALVLNNDSFYSVDVGQFNALLGASYTELAGRSRSMHKSQGFGSSQTVGETIEYLKLVHSREAVTEKDPFGFKGFLIENKEFNFIYKKIKYSIENKGFKEYMTNLVMIKIWFMKHKETPLYRYRESQVDEIIKQSCGLKITLKTDKEEFTQGESIPVQFSIVSRLSGLVRINEILPGNALSSLTSSLTSQTLPINQLIHSNLILNLAPNFISEMPWLKGGLNEAMFNDAWFNGGIQPGTDNHVKVIISLDYSGTTLRYEIPLQFISVDPVKGEIAKPVLIKPKLQLVSAPTNLLFINTKRDSLVLNIVANKEVSANLSPELTGNYSIEMDGLIEPTFKSGTNNSIQLNLVSNESYGTGNLRINHTDGLRSREIIEYDHIGSLAHCYVPEISLSSFSLSRKGRTIGYLPGAGDEVAKNLKAAGYRVIEFELAQVNFEFLKQFNVIILGVRAFNTLKFTENQHSDLLKFVEHGGIVITQYLTSRGMKRDQIGPYPLKIGNGRVTEENAIMKIINPNEPILNIPNKIESRDFEYWVQERGLYFVDEYDPFYRSVFHCHDIGEEDRDGSLIIGDYGKGSFIYTGLSFFRQLPAGVPGAYRLLGNIIDYEPIYSDKK